MKEAPVSQWYAIAAVEFRRTTMASAGFRAAS